MLAELGGGGVKRESLTSFDPSRSLARVSFEGAPAELLGEDGKGAELAEQIFTGTSPADRVAQIEATDDRFDRDLWSELAKANLLGVAVDEAHGGLGFGLVEATPEAP